MSFLYPTFLFALGAIAVPIVIHLFNFRRYKTVYFPYTRFLKEVKEKTDSRTQLKHLLVLCCRILAITFVVLAFAQPYLKREGAAGGAGKKTVSIYIDNSFSMGQTSGDVPLVELGKKKAIELVAAGNENDLFQLLTNEFEARQQRLVDKQEMLSRIREVKISPASRTLAEVTGRQQEALQAGAGSKSAYIISDFQNYFLDPATSLQDSLFPLTLIPLKSREAANLYIDTCWFQSPVQVLNQSSVLFVRLVNNSTDDLDNGRLTLKINEEIKAISDFSVSQNGIVTDTILFNVTEPGWNRVELSIVDHPITFDDSYFLTYEVAASQPVMVINGNESSPFLKAVFSGNEFFVLTSVSLNQLRYDEIMKQRLVVLDEVNQISSGLAAQLKTFLDDGGSIALFPGASADLVSFNSFLATVNAAPLGNFSAAEKTVTSVNASSRLFKNVFQRMNPNMALPKSTKAFSFARRTATNAEPLLSYSDGSAMLLQYEAGRGLLYVSAVSLNKETTDLPLSPLFAPMLYNMAIMRTHAPAPAYTIGRENLATVNTSGGNDEQILQLKGSQSGFIPAQRRIGNNINIYFDHHINTSGFLQLTDPLDQLRAWFAMNFDRVESELRFASPEQLAKVAGPLNAAVISNPDLDLGNYLTGQRAGLPLWKIAVIFALLFLAAEILLLKFWK
jgi:hypothetical protein